jgi:Uma2 family endonuclease
MLQTLPKVENQYLIKHGVTWSQFKTLQSAFAEIGGVRMTYCEEILEIMSIGLLHEMICTFLGALLIQYFMTKRICFTSTGAYSQMIEPKLEFQADLSYSFSGNPEITDLCIEVVVTSGSIKKLRKYQLRSIPEVWFWQDGKIKIYRLQDDEYMEVLASKWLPDLDIGHLERCLLMESQLDAVTAFAEKYNKSN